MYEKAFEAMWYIMNLAKISEVFYVILITKVSANICDFVF